MVEKVAGMPQWALVDAGGGVVVDLDANGQEVFSERKVNKLKETCAIVYVRVRGALGPPESNQRLLVFC